MERLRAGLIALATVLVGAGGFAGCAEEEYPASLWAEKHPDKPQSQPGSADASVVLGPGSCRQARAQPYPQKLVAISATAVSGNNEIYVTDLFNSFNNICGTCHGPSAQPGQGGFRIASPVEFSAQMDQSVLNHVLSNETTDPLNPNDDHEPMPPISAGGSAFSKRDPSDPVVTFAKEVQEWIDLNRPPGFTPGQSAGDGGADASSGSMGEGGAPSPFLMSPAVGSAMTNLGACIPDHDLVAHADSLNDAIALDKKFAALNRTIPGTFAEEIGLPPTLDQTDLTTFDTRTLAEHRVIAFQPAYPLWSDDAGKIRFVRVPLGQSIKFNKDTQEFDIPDNTRFYKTFMRRVADTDGSYRWKKIETRLIVVRHDTDDGNGNAIQNSLFGTYLWNASETQATLHTDLLNDKLPFADKLLTVTIDEQLSAAVLGEGADDPDYELVKAGAARHYAVPSSDRCIQCHMGSNSKTFVLGFRPVQINRRVSGEGGTTVEPGHSPATADELSQLQRFIDYGVVTGITSISDVLPLEKSEGTRKPRTPQELVAQGYMLGNCSHCHNPRGFPSVQNPVLQHFLSFLPGTGPIDGIFEFPLNKFSPRITRGEGGNRQIPYITPSLYDLAETPNFFGGTKLSSTDLVYDVAFAPWRSLIYRNVDTPFSYTSDRALFPHMPMDTAGYDCRARQILSDWMVSIPAVRQNMAVPEFGYPNLTSATLSVNPGVNFDDADQPYVEVKPESPLYGQATKAAASRLETLHTGVDPNEPAGVQTDSPYSRYNDCPDTSDILDPEVLRDPTCHAVPAQPTDPNAVGAERQNGMPKKDLALMGMPPHAHWINTDLTQPAGDWEPKRVDWSNVLIKHDFSSFAGNSSCPGTTPPNKAQIEQTVGLLQTATLDQIASFAKTELPMGLWVDKANCDLSRAPKASSFAATGGKYGPAWMNNPASQVSPDSHVYMEVPGAAVFNMICVNCHGPKADGHGRLSDNLLLMTGGIGRVADFRDGLFGPVGAPGQNRAQAANGFGDGVVPADAGANWIDASIDDRAARYMAFMALGGTEVVIPQPILQIVSNTRVFGVAPSVGDAALSANMLAVGRVMCNAVLAGTAPTEGLNINLPEWFKTKGAFLLRNPELITSNGHAELWLKLCSIGNPPPVRAIGVGLGNNSVSSLSGFYPQSIYGSAPVGSERGIPGPDDMTGIVPVDSTTKQPNLRPWCVLKSCGVPDQGWPVCPDAIDNGTNGGFCDIQPASCTDTSVPCCTGKKCLSQDDVQAWVTRGAINAGFAVFLYLDGLERGTIAPKPDYTQCELWQ